MRFHPGPRSLSRREFVTDALLGTGVCSLLAQTGVSEDAATIVNRDLTLAMEKAELSMLFSGSTEDECREWQQAFRSKLTQLLGDSTPPLKWTTVEESRVELKDHTRYELLLKAKRITVAASVSARTERVEE